MNGQKSIGVSENRSIGDCVSLSHRHTDSPTHRELLLLVKMTARVRPPEYLQDCQRLGHVDGPWLVFTAEAWSELCAKHPPIGAGDLAALVAKPTAKAIDAVVGS